MICQTAAHSAAKQRAAGVPSLIHCYECHASHVSFLSVPVLTLFFLFSILESPIFLPLQAIADHYVGFWLLKVCMSTADLESRQSQGYQAR